MRGRHEQPFVHGHLLECRLEASARLGRDLPQVGVQLGVGGTAVFAVGAVGLEVRQLQQQFGHVARALAGDRRREAREVGQGRIVPSARWCGLGCGCGAASCRVWRRGRQGKGVQPLRQHRVRLRLAQQRRAGRCQGFAHGCRPQSHRAPLSAPLPGRAQPRRWPPTSPPAGAVRARARHRGRRLCNAAAACSASSNGPSSTTGRPSRRNSAGRCRRVPSATPITASRQARTGVGRAAFARLPVCVAASA